MRRLPPSAQIHEALEQLLLKAPAGEMNVISRLVELATSLLEAE